MADLKDRLREKARELGFDAFGVAPIGPYPHAAFFEEWLRRGRHGSMAYLARNADRRLDPTRVLPDARSILVVAKLYRTTEIPVAKRNDPRRGLISRYAWGDDYHDRIGESLRRLFDWLKSEAGPSVEGRVYVDAGPVLEREVGMLAGLGWFGKNTMLLSRSLGSYFFLGEIVTNLPLEPDGPTTDHCGSCTRCLEACPTNAFPEPYTLDATRCLSYLTIENKGPIPRALRPQLGNWVFGCDICQEVCPWNRKAPFARDPAYEPRPGLVAPPLEELIALDAEAFRTRFKGNPIKRAKRRGLLRNVAVALGNTGDPSAVPALETALRDEEPLVRAHAAWALGRIGGGRAAEALRRALATETDPDVIDEIRSARNDLDASEPEAHTEKE